ncbi:hypothetical protein AKJ61_02990 [candidate division MSBL1 archaeon SCGC-AAA259B11]|uniref:Uncharacterized protein n=1 Tax=candidate division MSBL1 archaeon SCGC-AAA259B11 TaxID=1698260 RepID=A0A133U5D5_9EURY|nr:hypothetical protein AKJ61_02990 [candidate division MSBL1 archaeon SCGC-AAA259B11]
MQAKGNVLTRSATGERKKRLLGSACVLREGNGEKGENTEGETGKNGENGEMGDPPTVHS